MRISLQPALFPGPLTTQVYIPIINKNVGKRYIAAVWFQYHIFYFQLYNLEVTSPAIEMVNLIRIHQ